PGNAVIKVDFSEVEGAATDPSEMTVRIGGPVAKSLTDLTQRVPESFAGAYVNPAAEERLKVQWTGGEATIRAGSRVVLGRPHGATAPGFVALEGEQQDQQEAALDQIGRASCRERGWEQQ